MINKNKYNNEYNKYYSYNENTSEQKKEMLFKIMTTNGQISNINGFGLDISKSTLVIFTVINITPNPKIPVNNPPTPPFININTIKLIYKILTSNIYKTIETNKNDDVKSAIIERITKYIDKFIIYLKKYSFYIDIPRNLDISSIFHKESPLHIFNNLNDNDKATFKNFNEWIDSNNATTLIGTVDFEKFTKIRNPDEFYFICDDKKSNLLLELTRIDNINQLFNEETTDLDGKPLTDLNQTKIK